ncbi:MAG TPA: DNA-3-methyladenine glycosylase I [Acidimicrobiales bacterium]|nr:DNA-3-methyladenine glycosylase I [Acidimicrobiales bacterium]
MVHSTTPERPSPAPFVDDDRPRCAWAVGTPMVPYHDQEWGVPVHDDGRHFEFLVLEGAQAGLSWLTILKRREGYRKAFAGFDPAKVARFTEKRAEALMQDSGIIRNRLKIRATIGNAAHFLEVQEELGSFDDYLWGFVDGRPVVNRWKTVDQLPATSPLSDTVSADLRRRGFRFVGSTICYAHLQAVGVVNDHLTSCFRYRELTG